MANPSDLQYAVVPEVTAGTTPATPSFLRFPHVLGDTVQWTNDNITSPVMMPGRESAGAVKVGYRAEGSLKTHFMRDASIELLLASALSGAWVTNTLKAGNTDSNFTLEKRFTEGGTNYHRQFKGAQASKFNLSVEAASIADASFDIIAMSNATAASMITGANYAGPSSTTKKLTGLDVSAVTIAGITGAFAKLELAVEHTREAQYGFGSSSALGIGTAGMRKITGSVTMYRKDWSPETTLLNDTPVSLVFTIGATTSGYTFTLPAVTFSSPQDQEDGSKLFVKLDFIAGFDATLGTGIQIVRLT